MGSNLTGFPCADYVKQTQRLKLEMCNIEMRPEKVTLNDRLPETRAFETEMRRWPD